jgi:hypothetical protein
MHDAGLRKLFRSEIRKQIRPLLEHAGFTEFTDLTAWRRGPRTIEVVDIMTMGPRFGQAQWLGGELYATAATFMLGVGAYYLDLHRLPWAGPPPHRPICGRGESAKRPTVHREIDLARSDPDPGRIQGTTFYGLPDGSNVEEVIADAAKALADRGLPWLERTRDIPAFLSGESISSPCHSASRLELTESEKRELQDWQERTGAAAFMIGHLPPEFSEGLLEKLRQSKRQSNLRDHTALDREPYGDLRVGLLIGEGRIDDALHLQAQAAEFRFREEDSPTDDEIDANPELKRESGVIKRARKRWQKRGEEIRALEAEHLQMLQRMLER